MRTLPNLLLALLTLAVFAWAAWQGYLLLTREQNTLEPGTQSVLVIVAVLALVCTYMLSTALRKAALYRVQGPKKAELYEQFVRHWQAEAGEENEGQKELLARMALQASHPVLRALRQLITLAATEGRRSPKARAAFSALLMAMRADLGYFSFYTFKNDIDKLFQDAE